MKKIVVLFVTFSVFLFFSCKDEDSKATGTVVFGANYGIINCITTVNVFIDGKHMGQLEAPADSVPNCDVNYGIRMELLAGHYNYNVEIRPLMGSGCSKDVSGELDITEGGCETVFINYLEIFEN
ncbi:MAG: hypothetical protein R2757_07215 [Draconibacterium sp.]